MRQVTVTSSGLLLTTAAWTVVLATATSERSELGTVLIALSLWAATVVSLTGMLVARARWARRLGLAVTAAQGALALLISPDVWWGLALVLSAVTAVSLGGPWLDGIIRGRPSASGPPTRAVLLPLVLIGVPYLLGYVDASGLEALVVAVTALLTAFWFIRTLPGALAAVRVVWPALTLALAATMGWQAGVTAAGAAVAVATLAWHSSVRNAVHPLIETGSRVAIPPELAPREILDAADIDDSGRPR